MAGVAVVLVITFVGLFYLSQTFQSGAARYQVQQLLVQRQAMLQELQTQRAATLTRGSEGTVTQWAQGQHLVRLGSPYRVPAR